MDETERIELKLNDITQYVSEIEGILPKSLNEYLSSDLIVKRAFERDLQLISETQLEILALLARVKGTGIASSENGLVDKFRKILNSRTLEGIRELRKLRNVLTHAYANAKYDENVYSFAMNLRMVKTFAKEVKTIISKK